MSVTVGEEAGAPSLLKRQLAVCVAFCLLMATIVASLYWQDRQREWTLRQQQAKHRLEVAFELISREVERVRADALFLADQRAVRRFAQGDESHRDDLVREFSHFVKRKQTYDQIRLLNLDGWETIRVNYSPDRATAVDETNLQDKSDRYYFRESLSLSRDEVFVSEFDLNVEHGRLEAPLKPVIRFVAPVVHDGGGVAALLVLNYLGTGLLAELDDATIPGFTMLLRADGHYLRSPKPAHSWGWLLGHDTTFATQFPEEWSRLDAMDTCQLTPRGAFAAKRIPLGRSSGLPAATSAPQPVAAADEDFIIAVAYLQRDEVFVASSELLMRLLLLAGCVFIPVAVFARFWAKATGTRELQARRIAASEEKLRDLSSRLLRIQEDERRAISREIHDEFGQQVTAINLDLKLAERNIEAGRAKPHLVRAVSENETLLHSLHEFATRLRPAVLDDLGLLDAVESHLEEFQQRTGIDVEAELEFSSVEIPVDVADHAYRLLQESLNNVLKHAQATRVRVAMSVAGDDPSYLFVSVRDNGRGYAAHNHRGGLGLIGMRERVELLAGELRTHSDLDRGTLIEIKLPIHPRYDAERSS